MNELTGAVALAQLRKIDKILDLLKQKKSRLKALIAGIPGIGFRKLNDEKGECATLLTLLFKDKASADYFCDKIGSKTISHSGWHVYNNMEQILEKKTSTEFNCPYACAEYGQEVRYWKHMLPNTDNILERAVNISVGVVDKGLGASFGININSSNDEIDAVAARVMQIMKEI